MTSGSSKRSPSSRSQPASSPRAEILTPRARRLLPIFLVVLVVLAVRQLWWGAPPRVVLDGESMGTTWRVVLSTHARAAGDVAGTRTEIAARLARVNALMSTWDADSELSRFNSHASLEPFTFSAETFQVLELSREVSAASGGAFDVTVRPLVAAWGFGAGARLPGQGPDERELALLRARVGFELLELDASTSSARKQRPELEADLSAIAKGFAVDEIARALEELGWRDFLVEVGGEVRALGSRPGGSGWNVGIERPLEQGRAVHGVVALHDRGMATSGDYRDFYEEAGERRSHIIDPRSGRPVSHRLASVSVVADTTVVADAWATALSVLGPVDGFALAESRGLAAYFVWGDGKGGFDVRATPVFPPVRETHAGADADE